MLNAVQTTSRLRLPPGHLYGQNLRARSVGSLTLTEISYPPDSRVLKHSHELCQLCFVREGGFSEVFGRKTRDVKAFTLIARPGDEMHAHRFDRAGARCFVVEIGNESLRRVREYSSVMDDSAEFQSGLLAWLVNRLYHEFRSKDQASALSIEGLTLEILSEVSRRPATFERQPPRWLECAREFLHAHFTEPIHIAAVAEAVGIHPTHLTRAFRRFHRCTIGEYVRQLRIEFACREAALTQISLTDLAVAAGFYDQSHFSRTFKQLTGVTPSQYRAAFRAR